MTAPRIRSLPHLTTHPINFNLYSLAHYYKQRQLQTSSFRHSQEGSSPGRWWEPALPTQHAGRELLPTLGRRQGAARPCPRGAEVHPGPWRLALHGHAGPVHVQSSPVPPLRNHFMLPSSHEKCKPAQGYHGGALGCGSPEPIPPANTFPSPSPAGTLCPWLLSPLLLCSGE